MSNDRRNILMNFERYARETKQQITYGIEQYRKGSFCIHVLDKQGNPVPNVNIGFKQTKHEFKYGANIFMLDEMETDEKNRLYKEYFVQCFNMATLPFYWESVEPKKGVKRYEKNCAPMYRRPPIDLCMEFCEENGIEPREHGLAYEPMFPQWVRSLTTPQLKKEMSRRFCEIAERYADKIPTIEVTNEMQYGIGYKTGTGFYEEKDYVEWCFREAEKYFPHNQLAINENIVFNDTWAHGRNRDPYYMQIERALRKGARIDAIGMQFHMFSTPETEAEATKRTYDPCFMNRLLDKYSDFDLPLQITEVTIPAFRYTQEDEAIQAEIIKNLYSIWFSQKNMEQIIYWNLVDGYAAYAPLGDFTVGENFYRGGLLRHDLTPKPAYYAIRDLFQKEWHTEGNLSANQQGLAFFKGFFGEYELEIWGKTYTVNAAKQIRIDEEYNRTLLVVLDP